MQLYNLDLNSTNFLFMLEVTLHKFWFNILGTHDPTSEPFLSGDTFRSMADHVLDQRVAIDPDLVKKRDVVFVAQPLLKYFFREIHPRIASRYILISHNGDENISKQYLKYLDEKVLRWYAQNVEVYHPKLIPLPIGLENIDFYNHGIPALFEQRME